MIPEQDNRKQDQDNRRDQDNPVTPGLTRTKDAAVTETERRKQRAQMLRAKNRARSAMR